MKIIFLIIFAGVAVMVLMLLQLKSLKKHHPNAQLLLDAFKTLKSDQKTFKNGGQSS
jgi:hypothetical protein